MKAKLNKVIPGAVGEKKDISGESLEFVKCINMRDAYNKAKDEMAERDVWVDVERIANTLSFYIESGKWQLVSTLINSGDLADVAKAIAEEILKGNVIKVKEEKKY